MRRPLPRAFVVVASSVIGLIATVLAFVPLLLAAGCALAGCVDTPLPELEPQARLVAVWDPVVCGDPHRVVVELEDERGVPLSASVPCELGAVTMDVPHWGIYRGRIYAWTLGPEVRSVLAVRIEIDAPVIHWFVETPR